MVALLFCDVCKLASFVLVIVLVVSCVCVYYTFWCLYSRFMRRAARLDYKVYHETGVKVVMDDLEMAEGGAQEQTVDDLVLEELKLMEDIRHDFNLYNPDDLVSYEETAEALGVISVSGQKYRHLHVTLKSKLDDEEYDVKYPKYDENLGKITKFSKTLKEKLRDLRDEEGKAKIARDDNAVDQVRKKELEVEEDVLNLKVQTSDSSFNLALAEDVYEVDRYIAKMEDFISQYLDLLGKLKLCYSADDLDDRRIHIQIAKLSGDVTLATALRKKISDDFDSKKQEVTLTLQKSRNLLKAENLKKEILLRGDALELKFDRELHDLSDYQILEISLDKTVDPSLIRFWRK